MNNLLVLFIFLLETIPAQNVSVTISKKGEPVDSQLLTSKLFYGLSCFGDVRRGIFVRISPSE